jgi:hypothetical protein
MGDEAMQARDVMTWGAISVAANTPVVRAAQLMLKQDQRPAGG